MKRILIGAFPLLLLGTIVLIGCARKNGSMPIHLLESHEYFSVNKDGKDYFCTSEEAMLTILEAKLDEF